MGETEVEIPWMDEPLPVDEAVEVVAQAFNEDADETEELEDRVERLEGRLDDLEGRVESEDGEGESGTGTDTDTETDTDTDTSTETGDADSELSDRIEALERCVDLSNDATQVACPSCESSDDVLKDGVAAAVLVRRGALSDKNVGALNQESHLCLSCRKAFTPCETREGGDGGSGGDDHEALR